MTEVREEPFVGWKGLWADREGGLWSPSFMSSLDKPWPVGEYLFAECSVTAGHVPPVEECSCGIYACKTFDDLKNNRYNWDAPGIHPGAKIGTFTEDRTKTWVITRVALVGRVRAGAIGYRAEAAVVTHVLVSPADFKLGKKIRERYGVKLGFIDRFTGRSI